VARRRVFRRTPRILALRRLSAVLVLAVMAALYVNPVQRYLHASQQLAAQRAQVAELQQRHDALLSESSQLHTTAGVELLARECGWIFPHEQPLVIVGVPARDGAQCH
jgi:cell division protein FtsB